MAETADIVIDGLDQPIKMRPDDALLFYQTFVEPFLKADRKDAETA